MNTNTALIPIIENDAIHGRVQPLCDARDLHAFLGVRWAFTNWIKHLITKYGFVEGVDYEVFAEKRKNPQEGGRPTDEYHLTIDMAKQLAMVQNNERGRQARLYFIECERIAREKTELPTSEIPQLLPPGTRLLLTIGTNGRHRVDHIPNGTFVVTIHQIAAILKDHGYIIARPLDRDPIL